MTQKRATYTDELKAAVLADVVLLGPGAAAAKYGIPRGTIHTWQQQFHIIHDPSQKRARILDLAASYLEANFQALNAQAYVASTPEYIERQSAEGLAILHGVMADKSVRLLEALHAGSAANHPAIESGASGDVLGTDVD